MKNIFIKLLLVALSLVGMSSYAQFSGNGPVTIQTPMNVTSIQWFRDGQAIPGATNSTFSAQTPGVYYASFTDSTTACTDDRTNIFALVAGEGSVTINGATNYSSFSNFQWKNGTADVPGATTSSLTTQTGGLYSLTYFNGTCTLQTDAYYIYVLDYVPALASESPLVVAQAGQAISGNAATELAPSGGTSPYTYSNGSSDPLCVAPAGAQPLPVGANFTVNASGIYSYTAPATAGNYFYCMKVCDNSTPTPNCNVAVYRLTVNESTQYDIFPNVTFGGSNFTLNQARNIVINLNEIRGHATSGAIELFIPFSSGFTFAFNPALTNMTVLAPETINNTDWDLSTTTIGLRFTSKAGVTIPASGRSRIGLSITGTTVGAGATLSLNISPSSSENNAFNNLSAVAISVQN